MFQQRHRTEVAIQDQHIVILSQSAFFGQGLLLRIQALGYVNAVLATPDTIAALSNSADLVLAEDCEPALNACLCSGLEKHKIIAVQANYFDTPHLSLWHDLADILPASFRDDELRLKLKLYFRSVKRVVAPQPDGLLTAVEMANATRQLGQDNQIGFMIQVVPINGSVKVLKSVAKTIAQTVQPNQIAGWWRDTEIRVILCGATLEAAHNLTHKIQQDLTFLADWRDIEMPVRLSLSAFDPSSEVVQSREAVPDGFLLSRLQARAKLKGR